MTKFEFRMANERKTDAFFNSSFTIRISSLAFNTLRRCLPLNPLEQPAEHPSWSDFPVRAVALSQKVTLRIFPADGGDELFDEERADFFGVTVDGRIDVADDGNPRRVQF